MNAFLIFIFTYIVLYLLSFVRIILLRRIGKEILGTDYEDYAVLKMKDVTLFSSGFIVEQFCSFFLDPFWTFINLFAAFRAFWALKHNREVAVSVVYCSLTAKGKEVPEKVWEAFYKKNKEAKKYERLKY